MDPVDGTGGERLNHHNNDLRLMWPSDQRGLEAVSSFSPISDPHKGTREQPITRINEDLNVTLEKKNRTVKYYLPCPSTPKPDMFHGLAADCAVFMFL